MLSAAEAFTSNKLLHALPSEEFRQLKLYLEPVNLKFCQVIHHTEDPVDDIYFPANAVISNINMLEDGDSLETGIIGNEGITGISIGFSKNRAPCETIVQIPGRGWRIKAKDFWQIVKDNRALQCAVLAFIDSYTEQSTQSSVCAAHHPLAKRIVKRLLMYQDRVTEDTILQMKHESIALLLGVSRGRVTVAANELKKKGLINYSRGNIEILDRKGLEEFTCGCYSVIKQVYNRYLAQLKSKNPTRRLEQNNREFIETIKWSRSLSQETQKSISEFRRVKNKAIPLLIKICAECQRICDLQYNPQVIAKDNQRLLQVLSNSGICTNCRARNET